jgi:anti-sigma regulatory factor (Ser/Thr protein kinase)
MTNAPPTAPVAVRSWPSNPESVGGARHHLRDVLDRWGLEKLMDTAELVVSELVTNAVRHVRAADRFIEIRYQPTPEGGLRIEVHDADERVPVVREAGPEDESGRGLHLVDALTEGRWGFLPRSPREGAGAVGKLTWAHVGPGPGPGPYLDH